MPRISIRVTGRVQGVLFRAEARKTAAKLGLSGYAHNLPDGSVAIEAEGPERDLKKYLDWCHVGSPQSHIESVTFRRVEANGKTGFAIF
ncbi:MAG TPA: acylphosphatase [Candidatus Saccharimonadia bacterium]|nr:acylphosphatase [Candidatus Saccharimonadia bacterium]